MKYNNENRTITADAGMEIYKISEPTIYGKKIRLGKNDLRENYAERTETPKPEIEEDLPYVN